MFIDAKRTECALRQDGHVNGEGQILKLHMALLTEGVVARTAFYKHSPPDGGQPPN